jgi:hypothetical protein
MASNIYTVPNGVTSVLILAIGGGGGSGSSSAGGIGGDGGTVTTPFAVEAGDIITYFIGNGGDYGGGSNANASKIVPPLPLDDCIIDGDSNARTGGRNSMNGGGGGSVTCLTLRKKKESFKEYPLIVAGGGGGGCVIDGGYGGSGSSSTNGSGNSVVSGFGGGGGGGGLLNGDNGKGGSTEGFPGSFDNETGRLTLASPADNSGELGGGGGGGGFGGGGGGNFSDDTYSSGGGGSSYVTDDFPTSNVSFKGNAFRVGAGTGKGGEILNGQPQQGQPGSIIITPNSEPPAPCFHIGTRILTVNGYVPVEKLEKGDKVLTARGPTEIVEMVKFTSSMTKHPLYVLPKNTLGPNMPLQHLYMSHNHAFKHRGLWHHMKCSPLTKRVYLEEIEYYHILVDDYFKYTIKAENVEVETCFRYKEDNKMMTWYCSKVCCQPLKVSKVGLKIRAEKIMLPEMVQDFKPNMIGPNMIGPNMIGPNMIGPNMIGPNMIGPNNIVKLTSINRINIQKRMIQPFDPRRDTYQVKSPMKQQQAFRNPYMPQQQAMREQQAMRQTQPQPFRNPYVRQQQAMRQPQTQPFRNPYVQQQQAMRQPQTQPFRNPYVQQPMPQAFRNPYVQQPMPQAFRNIYIKQQSNMQERINVSMSNQLNLRISRVRGRHR